MDSAGKVPVSQLPVMDYDTKGADAAVLSKLEGHEANVGNPHKVTKSLFGLGNVDNTSDVGMPVSTAAQVAIHSNAAGSGSGTFRHNCDCKIPVGSMEIRGSNCR